MRWSVRTIPPGTSVYFATERDELGNENYVGPPLILGPTGETLPEPLPPTYASAPSNGVTQTKPEPVEPPGSKVFEEIVRDGVRLVDGGVRKLSTGELVALAISGWTNSEYAKESDNIRATDYNLGGDYGNILAASGFDFSSIPENATIRGIKVRVERSKVPEANPPATPKVYPDGDVTMSWGSGSTFYQDTIDDGLTTPSGFVTASAYNDYTYNDPRGVDGVLYASESYHYGIDLTTGARVHRGAFPDVDGFSILGRHINPDRMLWVSRGTAKRINVSEKADWGATQFDPVVISSTIDIPGASSSLQDPRKVIVPLPHLGDGVFGAYDGGTGYLEVFDLDSNYYGFYDIGQAFASSVLAYTISGYFEGLCSLAGGYVAAGYADRCLAIISLDAFGVAGCSVHSEITGAAVNAATGSTSYLFDGMTTDGTYLYTAQFNPLSNGGDVMTKWDLTLARVAGYSGNLSSGSKPGNSSAIGKIYL